MGEVKDRAIIMTTTSVRETLAGRKTQTRRLVDMRRLAVMIQRQLVSDLPSMMPRSALDAGRHLVSLNRHGAVFANDPRVGLFGLKPGEFDFVCPYATGRTELVQRNGDNGCWTVTPSEPSRLWVKETWDYFGGNEYLYQADANAVIYRERDENIVGHFHRKWRTPLFMPYWASRIKLEVPSVRLQRLQDISEDDARAEGVEPFFSRFPEIGRDQRITSGEFARDAEHRASYAVMWDEINGNRALWKTNPWIWAITYRRANG